MTLHHILAVAILAPLALASPGFSQESGWRLRIYGLYMQTADQPTIEDGAGTRLTTDNGSGAGIGLNAEYRFGSRLGLELGVVVADHGDFRADVAIPDADVEATDTMTVTLITSGLNYHLTPEAKVDLYVGALLALVDYDSFDIRYDPAGAQPIGFPTSAGVDIDSDLGFGLELGLDLPLDEKHWILHANVRYIKTSIDGSGRGASLESVDYDPLLIGLGFGYRF